MSEPNPPPVLIARALQLAAFSPCRSKRGVVVFSQEHIIGEGHNSPPGMLGCPGRARCAGTCGERSVHAEARALREATAQLSRMVARGRLVLTDSWDLLHVELAPGKAHTDDDAVVACSGPSCATCAREILDCGIISGVWLCEAVPEDHCPHLPEHRRVDCPLCQGENCDRCRPGPGKPRCDHDVLDRHGDLPVITARWVRYTAAEFYRVTLQNCGIP